MCELKHTVAPPYISPWIDVEKPKDGRWELPKYPCEIKGIDKDDPRNVEWTPGEYIPDVDNVYGDGAEGKLWGGQKLWQGDDEPPNWDPTVYPTKVQELLKVPHMPGQPVKEMFARLKVAHPKIFEDRYYDEIKRTLPENWKCMFQEVYWAEQFGIHTSNEPAEWRGSEIHCTPAVYTTPRPNTVTLCIGLTSSRAQEADSLKPSDDARYDFLEYLYAKDQNNRIIQIGEYRSYGITKTRFSTFSFIPPHGTTRITPFACFAFRGVWKGDPIEWDPTIENDAMAWYSKFRIVQADGFGDVKPSVVPPYPVNSYQGNLDKAINWDQSK